MTPTQCRDTRLALSALQEIRIGWQSVAPAILITRAMLALERVISEQDQIDDTALALELPAL